MHKLWRHMRTNTPWVSLLAVILLVNTPVYGLPWFERAVIALLMFAMFLRVLIKLAPAWPWRCE